MSTGRVVRETESILSQRNKRTVLRSGAYWWMWVGWETNGDSRTRKVRVDNAERFGGVACGEVRFYHRSSVAVPSSVAVRFRSHTGRLTFQTCVSACRQQACPAQQWTAVVESVAQASHHLSVVANRVVYALPRGRVVSCRDDTSSHGRCNVHPTSAY